MNVENEKCVIVVDENLPLGIIANTAAILGITMRMKMPDVVGNDVLDLEGNPHMGIIQFPVPILKGNTEILKNSEQNCLSRNLQSLQLLIFLIWHKDVKLTMSLSVKWRTPQRLN